MKLQEKINNIFFNKKIRYIVYAFLGFQFLSIIGDVWPSISSLVFISLVLITAYLSFKNIELGFLIIVFEFVMGHGGHLFEFSGLSIRSALFILVIAIWIFKKVKNKDFNFLKPKSPLLIVYYLFLFLVGFGCLNGWFTGNG